MATIRAFSHKEITPQNAHLSSFKVLIESAFLWEQCHLDS